MDYKKIFKFNLLQIWKTKCMWGEAGKRQPVSGGPVPFNRAGVCPT